MNQLKIEMVATELLKPYADNAKEHPAEQIEQIKKSIVEFGFNDPIAVWHDNEIIEGHGRLIAALELEMETVPVIRLDDLTDEQRRAYMLVHNKLTMNSDFNMDLLALELDNIADIDMSVFGFDDLSDVPDIADELEHKTLGDRFIVPPFSVLDTRQGYWQDRKQEWKDWGVQSSKGREKGLTYNIKFGEYDGRKASHNDVAYQTSIFDPVLCELMYKWFNVNNGIVYDCFAGGSVRGIIAEKLGYNYTGIDLRQEQIDANHEQAVALDLSPVWICDDSLNVDNYIDDESVDMVFTCPPYADLEKYSDDPRDISNMKFDDFKRVYAEILTKSCNKLKNNRFAVIVIWDVRDKSGAYRNLIDITKSIVNSCGLVTYNEFILVEQCGSAAVRATKQFEYGRKMVKTHQNVLVFYKGNTKEIKKHFHQLDFSGMDADVYENDKGGEQDE